MTQIAYLADFPEHVAVVTSWVYGQWGHHYPKLTQEVLETDYRTRLKRDAIPLTLVAVADNFPAGTASIVRDDMPIRPQYRPWMASVYVVPDYRRQGIGSSLVQAIEAEACKLGIEILYLYTPDRGPFYARLGWEEVEWLAYHGEQVVVMRRRLS